MTQETIKIIKNLIHNYQYVNHDNHISYSDGEYTLLIFGDKDIFDMEVVEDFEISRGSIATEKFYILDKTVIDVKVGELVWFQAYKDSKPVQGRIKRIGTQKELGVGWNDDDRRTFYELETIGKDYNFIFTRTTGTWISKTKQSWEQPEY